MAGPSRADDASGAETRLLRAMADAAPDSFFVKDAQRRYVFVNRAMCALFRCEPDTLLGRTPEEVFDPESARIVREVDERTYAGEVVRAVRELEIDGVPHTFETTQCPLEQEGGRIEAICGFVRNITAQVNAEHALQQSESRYRALFDTLGVAVLVMNGDRCVACNPRCARVFGFADPADLVGRTVSEFAPPTGADEPLTLGFDEGALPEEPCSLEWHTRRAGGEELCLDVRVTPFESNGTRLSLCVAIDITERRRSEDALRRSEESKRSLLTAIPDLMFVVSRDGTFIDYHAANPQLLAAPPEVFLGKTASEVLPPHVASQLTTAVKVAIETGRIESFDYELPLPSGARWFEARLAACGADSVIGVVRDITDRERSKVALAAEKEQLAVTLRSIGDGVITSDTDDRVVLLNRIAEELTGWTQDEAVGQPMQQVFRASEDEAHLPLDAACDKSPGIGRLARLAGDKLLASRDATVRVISASHAPIRDNAGNPVGVVHVFRDVTRQRSLEEEVQRNQKLESLGLLAGGIAHDFNNLLTGILGNVSLARLHAAPGSAQAEWLDESRRAIERARSLTQQLLTFAKGGTPIRRPARIDPLIRDSAVFALRGSNVKAEISVAPALWPVTVDEGQIGQVLANLLVNAEEAMPDGGTVWVTARNLPRGASIPVDLPEGDYVEISIADEGCGIPEEHHQRIFEPYFSTKPKGSGLGLTTSDAIVRKHDGRLKVRAREGGGSVFSVFLPASSLAPPEPASCAPVLPGTGRVLVMDDDAAIRQVSRQMLELLGYDVETACDGAEALETFRRARESHRPFDAIVMDLTVPGGMGGKEAVRKVLELDPDAKVLVSSGYSNDAIMSDFRAYGFAGVIVKPYELETLSAVLRGVLAR